MVKRQTWLIILALMVTLMAGCRDTVDNPIFSDGFEWDKGWEAKGMWHRHSAGLNIYNNGFPFDVSLAPGDYSGGRVPDPYAGSRCYWYGDSTTGNYYWAGNTNSASLTSPIINLWGLDQPYLAFRTWFEIEGSFPSVADLMYVEISVNGGAFQTLGYLNPSANPTNADPKAPYTSKGYNQAPAWIVFGQSLSSYRNQQIRLRFTFDTTDHWYNRFRGWLIDNVAVGEENRFVDVERTLSTEVRVKGGPNR